MIAVNPRPYTLPLTHKMSDEQREEEYFKELELKHQEYIRSLPDPLEWFDYDVEEPVSLAINEFTEQRDKQIDEITAHRQKHFDEAQQVSEDNREWFLQYWNEMYVQYLLQPQLTYFERRISRLTHDLYAIRRKKGTMQYSSKQEEWEDKKSRARERLIEEIATPYLENPRRYGNMIRANCPFHEEKTPSFYLYINENKFHCFGCSVHGNDVIDFYMKIKNVDFKTAVEDLA